MQKNTVAGHSWMPLSKKRLESSIQKRAGSRGAAPSGGAGVKAPHKKNDFDRIDIGWIERKTKFQIFPILIFPVMVILVVSIPLLLYSNSSILLPSLTCTRVRDNYHHPHNDVQFARNHDYLTRNRNDLFLLLARTSIKNSNLVLYNGCRKGYP